MFKPLIVVSLDLIFVWFGCRPTNYWRPIHCTDICLWLSMNTLLNYANFLWNWINWIIEIKKLLIRMTGMRNYWNVWLICVHLSLDLLVSLHLNHKIIELKTFLTLNTSINKSKNLFMEFWFLIKFNQKLIWNLIFIKS